MTRFNLEKPEMVFIRVPQIEDICIEFGIDRTDAKTVTCMYELFKRITDVEYVVYDEEAYEEGYKDGYNTAIEKAEDMIDRLALEVRTLKK